MRADYRSWGVGALVVLIVAGSVLAQPGRPRNRNRGGNEQRDNQQPAETPAEPEFVPPTDPQLLALHNEFLAKAEKLATDYERARQFDKARDVYEQILRLVPNHPAATKKLTEIREREFAARPKIVTVAANGGWQPTGIGLVAGKPVRIVAEGEWTFRMDYKLSADGMEIPEELRDFRLGSLIGMVAAGDPKEARPFQLGAAQEYVPDKSGELLLRMYDSDPKDNVGQLTVKVTGTYETR